MNYKNIIYSFSAFLCSFSYAVAQPAASGEPVHKEPWTLSECISYAIDRNITIKQQEIARQNQELELSTAVNSRLPDLNGSVNENLSFGRGLTSENIYSNNNTTSTGVTLGSSVPVFQGLRIRNTIKQNQLSLQAATEDLEQVKDDIRIKVAQAYLQILFSMDLSDIARQQVAIDSMQVERLTELAKNGKANGAEVAQQKAALSESRLNAVQAENDLSMALLDLSQLLELHNPEGFSIVKPEAGSYSLIMNPDEIYADAIASRPAVKAEEFRLEALEWTVKNAKSYYMPTLSLSGGIGTNYYTVSGGVNASFANQMKNNFSQYVGISMTVPIFNRLQTRNQVQSARLAKINQELQLESMKKSLYKEIQQAYYNAVAAREKYASSTDAMSSSEVSYNLILSKYENGKASITEFIEARNRYLSSVSSLSRTRYEYLFSVKLLDFYRGGELTL